MKRRSIIRRPRRLRANENIRGLVRETAVTRDDLIMPVFIRHGKGVKAEIPSMPGIYHFSPDTVLKEIEALLAVGISRIILFGIPEDKDRTGSESYHPEGIIQESIAAIKKEFPELYLITDVCMCEYTDHGHCGIVVGDAVDNDVTLEYLQKQAVTHAQAGADMLAPSGMMDAMVKAIREALNEASFRYLPIMSYSVKFASAFYGPFREAAESTPQFGDRKSYQMDPANRREALKEAALDIEEGADILMVKPALAYLDIISALREDCNLPIGAYNVSGEYSMIKAAAEKNWIDGEKAMVEMLTGIKRAGADIILTYFAKEFAALKS